MNHPVSNSCKDKLCGPCGRAGVRVPATHKIGEEFLGEAAGVCHSSLIQYVCCSCFALLMGPAAQQACGVGMPGLPRLVPVYGLLGEKLAASGAVETGPSGTPSHLFLLGTEDQNTEISGTMDPMREEARRAWRSLRIRPDLLEIPPHPETSRAERDLRQAIANLNKHLRVPAATETVVDAPGEEASS